VSATELAAWIGAATGTLALVLEFVKWVRSGARLEISSNSNMTPLEPTRDFPSKPHLFVWVRNVGDTKTTITTFGLTYYKNPLLGLVGRGGEHGIVIGHIDPLPKILQPGEQWTTFVKRGPLVENARNSGSLYCSVWHSMSRKPTTHKVGFEKVTRSISSPAAS
jgi:hypothetical protein